jgi:hypothetical protein
MKFMNWLVLINFLVIKTVLQKILKEIVLQKSALGLTNLTQFNITLHKDI